MVIVEYYNGEPLSYMTNKTRNILSQLCDNHNVQIIPVTTRLYRQFSRIVLPSMKYSILGNGSQLYIDGEIDYEWLTESLQYVNDCLPELCRARTLMNNFNGNDYTKFCDDMFMFTKSDNPRGLTEHLCNNLDLSKATICEQGSKIYVLPRQLNKGFSIDRFRKRFCVGTTVSAGDAVLDFPMSEYSDIFITSNCDCNFCNVIHSKSNIFSDEIVDYISSLVV